MFKHTLGVEVKDKVTGLRGILTGRCEHLYGCNTYGITPKVTKDGSVPDCQWFDEGRIQVVGKGIKPKEVQVKDPGAGANPTSAHGKL